MKRSVANDDLQVDRRPRIERKGTKTHYPTSFPVPAKAGTHGNHGLRLSPEGGAVFVPFVPLSLRVLLLFVARGRRIGPVSPSVSERRHQKNQTQRRKGTKTLRRIIPPLSLSRRRPGSMATMDSGFRRRRRCLRALRAFEPSRLLLFGRARAKIRGWPGQARPRRLFSAATSTLGASPNPTGQPWATLAQDGLTKFEMTARTGLKFPSRRSAPRHRGRES